MSSKRKAAAQHPMAGSKALDRVQVSVVHAFTVEEYQAKTHVLTSKMNEVELREEGIKAEAAKAKAEVKGLRAEVNELANLLRNGSEVRTVDATVKFHRKKGTKKFFFFAPGTPDHGKLIREESMKEEDFNNLPFDDEDEQPATAGLPAAASEQPAKTDVQLEPPPGGEAA